MNYLSYSCALALAIVSLFLNAYSEEIRDYYAESGVQPFKTTIEHLNETINPFSGQLTISHIDLSLPGPAGFDINLTRYYNHHRDPNRWPSFMSHYGLGWTMHFGRIVSPKNSLCKRFS